jgi:hypothetical protein
MDPLLIQKYNEEILPSVKSMISDLNTSVKSMISDLNIKESKNTTMVATQAGKRNSDQ